MSNEDRIRNWRQRREAAAAGSREQTAPEQAFLLAAAAVADSPAPARAALSMVLDALSRAPGATAAERRAVYAALRDGQARGIEREVPAEETADFHRRQLGAVIRQVEHDIRAEIDVHAAGYAPAGLDEINERLTQGHARRARLRKVVEEREARRRASRLDVALEMDLPAQEAPQLAALRRRLAGIHARQLPARAAPSARLSRTLIPLLLLQLHVIHRESRVALLWALLGPAVLLSVISSLYFLTGVHYILGMDVATFSLLGATTWIMFRQIVFRSSTSYVSARSLINLEAVSPLTLALTQALIYLCIYLLVFAVLLGAGYGFGLVTLPASRAGFLLFVVLMGVGGACTGVLFGSIATVWPYFLRFAPVIERILQVFSGVFFVSEQLPEQYRGLFLWSPFAHGMQLLRSAYFTSYRSSDASLSYFLTSLVFLGAVALAAERAVRSNVQPM
ncbi:sugar ABC transporter permease [Bordetella genomosp. 10]|uniref:Sugar ABC transporter permease n=1 Tax=Bordetella genomosp. 10 TaxID=1416804 RepID=A0A261SBI2_9BORD|nr:ABC transporter permease [Bordetella genomosp. 10]OZI34759.1 sugar ABC transporter permease [Bordetella genomosp. 10]